LLIPESVRDGFDQTKEVNIAQIRDVNPGVIAFAMPKTSFYLHNKDVSVNLDSDAVYPENWNRVALNPFAKVPWNTNIDVPLKFNVSEGKDNTLSFEFDSQSESFNSVFSSLNEIYISIDNEFMVENPNIMVPGQYTIAFPELSNGEHIVLVNIILPDNIVASGTCKLKIKN